MSSRFYIAAIVVVVCVIGLGAWYIKGRRVSSLAPPTVIDVDRRGANRDSERLKRELRQLRSRVNGLEGSQRRIFNDLHDRKPAQGQVATSVDSQASAIKRPKITAAAEVAAFLDRAHDKEVKDPAWSASAEKDIEKVFVNPELIGVTLRQVDCRATMCRLDVALEDGADRDMLFTKITKQPPFAGPGFIHIENPGDRRVEWYIARIGRRLPNFRQAP